MENERPTPLSTAIIAVGVVVVAAAAVWQAPNANWELALLGTLLAFSIVSEIMSVETESHLKISGNYLAMIPAMVFLGGTPAAVIGLISILVGWIRYRDNLHDLLVNVGTFITFPLVVGVGFQEVVSSAGITDADIAFYVLVFGAFVAGIAMNFLMIGADSYYMNRELVHREPAHGPDPAAPVGARGRPAGRRGRLRLRPDRPGRGRPVRHRPRHLPVPARRPAAVAGAGARARGARQAAGQLPGRHVERPAAHARPQGPDDGAPLGRRRPLLAGDRPARRPLEGGRGARPHLGAAPRHRQVHPPRPDPEGERAAHRRGLDADQAPPAAGRARRLLARRLRAGGGGHPRPPRADRRQGLSARPRRARKSRSSRGSSRSPTPTT